jgi:hypothetical protein
MAVLTEIPGASYGVMFTQSSAQIGLSSVPWPEIEQAVAKRVITRQRTKDTQQWNHDEELANAPTEDGAPRKYQDSNISQPLTEPEPTDYED